MMDHDFEVIIIGSGFGASVAALRFSESGKSVAILERGCRIKRENFEADGDLFWLPKKGYYGMNHFSKRGRHIVPWVGAGVGGGSHVYAGTLKRREFFDDFPIKISTTEMEEYYSRAEKMMDAKTYPDYAPYNQLPSYKIFRNAEKILCSKYPNKVEKQGNILLGISYAPPNGQPGAEFINKHGAKQRYSDPEEQKILGGEIDVKNTLDKNYLFLAEKHGAIINEFHTVYKIETLNQGGYKIFWKDSRKDSKIQGELNCQVLICSAGAIGSTELLLKNKLIYKTLPQISNALGETYYSNGDYITFIIPKKGLALSWLGILGIILGLIINQQWLLFIGIMAYLIGWIISNKKQLPDKGTTNSDYIRFKHRDGSPQGLYIEGGRYPTPIKAFAAVLWSITGKFKPDNYAKIDKVVNFLGKYIPVFELIERTWPIPLLMMGRDDAVGNFKLNKEAEAEIEYPFEKNESYVNYLEHWGRIFAKAAKSYFISNFIAKNLKIVEVPHNLGGCCMGANPEKGVVDSYGRVFNYPNFLILDGSILPCSLGPNPALTILAFAERSMDNVIKQLAEEGKITAKTNN